MQQKCNKKSFQPQWENVYNADTKPEYVKDIPEIRFFILDTPINPPTQTWIFQIGEQEKIKLFQYRIF